MPFFAVVDVAEIWGEAAANLFGGSKKNSEENSEK